MEDYSFQKPGHRDTERKHERVKIPKKEVEELQKDRAQQHMKHYWWRINQKASNPQVQEMEPIPGRIKQNTHAHMPHMGFPRTKDRQRSLKADRE